MAEKDENKEKKIIIDEDWKKQAEQEKKQAPEKKQDERSDEQQQQRGPLPKGDFAAMISMLVTQALFSMGALKLKGQEREPDLDMARYNIDMLEALKEKTKGNLTDQEEKILTDTLSQVRMAYVKATDGK